MLREIGVNGKKQL